MSVKPSGQKLNAMLLSGPGGFVSGIVRVEKAHLTQGPVAC
jgi:hypothetical protein